MSPVRLVVKDQTSRAQVNSFAWKEGWTTEDFNPGGDLEPFKKVWLTEDLRTATHYIEDPMVGIRYLALEGDAVEQVEERLRSALSTYSQEELLLQAREAPGPEQLALAIRRVGVGAPVEFNQESFDAITGAMAHADPRVRAAGIVATAFAAWREFKEPLERLSSSDPDTPVRELAGVVLRGLLQKNWKEA